MLVFTREAIAWRARGALLGGDHDIRDLLREMTRRLLVLRTRLEERRWGFGVVSIRFLPYRTFRH